MPAERNDFAAKCAISAGEQNEIDRSTIFVITMRHFNRGIGGIEQHLALSA